jgi:hypothetical protein
MGLFDTGVEMADKKQGFSSPRVSPIDPGVLDYTDKGKSGIHINPANKGKLGATSKKTGKSFSQLAHSKNPLTRKRAQFALNARKFHHGKKK